MVSVKSIVSERVKSRFTRNIDHPVAFATMTTKRYL